MNHRVVDVKDSCPCGTEVDAEQDVFITIFLAAAVEADIFDDIRAEHDVEGAEHFEGMGCAPRHCAPLFGMVFVAMAQFTTGFYARRVYQSAANNIGLVTVGPIVRKKGV